MSGGDRSAAFREQTRRQLDGVFARHPDLDDDRK